MCSSRRSSLPQAAQLPHFPSRRLRLFRQTLSGDLLVHGYSERHNRPVQGEKNRNYDTGADYWGDTIGAYVSSHNVIVVKLDGYNPRKPKEDYVRPWNIGPVETERQFPYYFPELVAYIDSGYRTIADRNHRATAGLSMGGFMSFWVVGKYPHLISSASNFMGSSEFVVGTRGLDVEYRHDEMYGNYGGVRTRLVTGTKDFIQFYHRRMNAIWLFTAPDHQTQEYEFDHGTPRMASTLDFHMHAFANPLPRPAVWNHIDVYQFFDVWGWSVGSDRRTPGFTSLQNVSKSGFRCSVREWVPSGPVLPKVKLTIMTDRLYPPGSVQTVRWETSNPSVGIPEPAAKLPALAPGASAEATLTLNVFDESREIVRMFAMAGGQKLPIDIPLFPPAEISKDFRVADSKPFRI